MATRAELKRRAKEQVQGNILTLFLIALVIAIIMGASSFTVAVAVVVSGPLMLGGVYNQKRMFYRQKADFTVAITEGFKTAFANSLVLYILHTLFICLWSLLLIIPGIIKSYAYSMSYYILSDNNQISGNDAITESRKMMDGHKAELFILDLSFIPEMLLGIITLGIYFIWLVPKIKQTKYNFYLELTALKYSAAPPPPAQN